MDEILNVNMPEAMISGIGNLAKQRNCSVNTVVKLAVAKFLFDQTFQQPNIYPGETRINHGEKNSDDLLREIPLDRIVSVQYTLDDGRTIHVLRGSKRL